MQFVRYIFYILLYIQRLVLSRRHNHSLFLPPRRRALRVALKPFGAGEYFRSVTRFFKTLALGAAQGGNCFKKAADRQTSCKTGAA
jgi:hypothetical protein